MERTERSSALAGNVTPGEAGTGLKNVLRQGSLEPEAQLTILLERPVYRLRVTRRDFPVKDMLGDCVGPFGPMQGR